MNAQPLGQIFKQMGLVTEYDIQQALAKQKETGESIGQILVSNGLVTEVDLSRALAEQKGMEFVDREKIEIPPEALAEPTGEVPLPVVEVSRSAGDPERIAQAAALLVGGG